MRIENMMGSNGNRVANQFLIYSEDGVYFQSYDSIIAFKPYGNNKIQLDENTWDYSNTTGKYRNIFLRESERETEEKIRKGIYVLTDLNKETI